MTNDIIDLQIKVAYLENTVEALDKVIAQQDKALQDLQDQLKLLYQQLHNKSDHIAAFDVLADKPPHY